MGNVTALGIKITSDPQMIYFGTVFRRSDTSCDASDCARFYFQGGLCLGNIDCMLRQSS